MSSIRSSADPALRARLHAAKGIREFEMAILWVLYDSHQKGEEGLYGAEIGRRAGIPYYTNRGREYHGTTYKILDDLWKRKQIKWVRKVEKWRMAD